MLVDRRGTGLSDPLRSVYSGGDFGPWLEEAVSDFVTVFDAIGSDRPSVLSNRYGTTVVISLAATHPDRVAALVPSTHWGGYATEDYPWGMTRSARSAGHTARVDGATG